jgi:Xaa-Pro aminopeptidase
MRPSRAERASIALACDDAMRAYVGGAASLVCGISELEVSLSFRRALNGAAVRHGDARRSGGAFYCMSGRNGEDAFAAFQRSRHKCLERGEPVLVHCNSYVDGYWTDLTRTYVLGPPDGQLMRIYEAIMRARAAAFDVIRPGARAADVDRAAREVLARWGYADAFKHATGHGVGFSAIDHGERPRIHPASSDILESGMVFNVEPGVYIPGLGGVRDCNMVAVTESGYELLSPFHLGLDELHLKA